MLDLKLIEYTIDELENKETTFTTCEQLAALYSVREHVLKEKKEKQSKKDFTSMLPWYKGYIDIKCKYAKHQVTDEALCEAAKVITQEIKDFLKTLYANADIKEEKEIIEKMFSELHTII